MHHQDLQVEVLVFLLMLIICWAVIMFDPKQNYLMVGVKIWQDLINIITMKKLVKHHGMPHQDLRKMEN
jgi:hypothetical protein